MIVTIVMIVASIVSRIDVNLISLIVRYNCFRKFFLQLPPFDYIIIERNQ